MTKEQYLSQEKFNELKSERERLKKEDIPGLAKRIDDARQMGDLSENAEYHAAREDMSWAQSRVKQIDSILDSAEIIDKGSSDGTVGIGSSITVLSENAGEKIFTIVGAQEADPMNGKISNESPLGSAFLGRAEGDEVEVEAPAGIQRYILKKIV